MPGGQEPKEKKRKRPDRREKEKPLLAVQVTTFKTSTSSMVGLVWD